MLGSRCSSSEIRLVEGCSGVAEPLAFCGQRFVLRRRVGLGALGEGLERSVLYLRGRRGRPLMRNDSCPYGTTSSR